MKRRFLSVKAWVKAHRIQTIAASGLLLIAVAGSTAFALLSQPLPQADTTPIAVTPRPKVFYSLLTGLQVKQQFDLTKPVTAIMIENSPDARPQSGLKDAEIVYEAIAEGGITRFMALYQQNKPKLIGPVRSVRPYYLDWVKPYDASIVHVGGSAVALKEVRNGTYRDLDQFFNAGTYWRTSDRPAPHNVYTNFKRIDALNTAKQYSLSTPKSFTRKDIDPATPSTASSISVHISGPTFDSSYSYNKTKQYYTRSQAGAVHVDREKGAITPKVIIVIEVTEREEFQDTTREVIQTTGKGNVTIFQAGKAIKGTWSRTSRNAQYTFTDKNGKEIALDRGQTWITAIPSGTGTVSWK